MSATDSEHEAREDRTRWEARYGASPLERKAPPAWLTDHLDRLPRRGRALDVAMGLGGGALALARHGLTVTGLDIAPSAVQQVAGWAREESLPVEAIEADARTWSWPQESLDVITQFYFLERTLFERIRDALRPGGWVLVETFSARNLEIGALGPKRREWCLERGELLEYFVGYRIHAFREAVLEGPVAVQSVAAQKSEAETRG